MSIEQRLEQVEKQTKRLRVAVVVLATALCGVVSMAAKDSTESIYGVFDTVIAKRIFVQNDKGKIKVALSSSTDGGVVQTFYGKTGVQSVVLGSVGGGEGTVMTYAKSGKELVKLSSTDNGGAAVVYNKTGEGIVSLWADEYGNGEVVSWNRKGKGRSWRSQ
tara:strand:- start:479 stop:964 length:486 start_codon:yes stop_codon:yes gene_type:complete